MSQPGVNIVDFVAMSNARVAFQQTEAQLKNIETGVITAVDSLEQNWTGDASAKFNAMMRSWTGSFNDIIKLMDSMEQTLGGNQRVLMNNEQNNNPMIDKVASQIKF